jgi:hypothetical protein
VVRLVLASDIARSKARTKANKQAELHYQGEISSRLELLDAARKYLQAE